MKGLRLLSPNNEKSLPGLPKTKNPLENKIKHTYSKSPRMHLDNSSKLNYNSKISSKSPVAVISELPDLKLTEDMKKLNSYFSDSSFNKSFFTNSFKITDFFIEDSDHGPPSGRKDAKILMEWVEFMLKKNADQNNDNPEQLFEIANEIYSACITEAIRQVTVHCKERGFLISKVWQAYRNLFEKALKISDLKYQALVEKSSTEKNKIHSSYKETIKENQQKINTLLNEKNKILEKLDILTQDLKNKSEKENKLISNTEILQTKYKTLKKELFLIREEARILKIRYENIGADNEYNSIIKRFIMPKKFKIKTIAELEKELNKDPLTKDLYTNEKELIQKIHQYGKLYIEKNIEQMFSQNDFDDKGSETNLVKMNNMESQTDIEITCGETVAVKKRKGRVNYTSNTMVQRTFKPMFFPDFRPYNQKTIEIESQNLISSPIGSELKKKYIRVKKLLNSIKEVIFQQEYR